MLTSPRIKAHASELGFDLCGIAPAGGFPELGFLRQWIDRGYAGEMGYMAQTAPRRADVRCVLPSARAVVALATVYNVERPYSTEVADPQEAQISRYAWGDDYHDVLGERTNALLAWMRQQNGEPFEAKAYVDTGPVQERVYAQYAGLGWIGKNTCLINPEIGSWLFLSEILCSLQLEPDLPAFDHCGTCTLCLDACPTGALVDAGVLDATRCLSYLTIELKGAIPEARRDDLGSHIYGCDICQEVCPWNAAPRHSAIAAWQPRRAFDRPHLVELWRRSDAQLREPLVGSAMRRAGVTRLRRNLAVAMGNCGDPTVAEAFAEQPGTGGDSPSRTNALVAEHVEWATRKLEGRTGA